MIDVFIKIIDTCKDEFFLQDTSTKQIYSPTEDEIQIMFVKYWEQPLLNHLRALQAYYELVIFTTLPRNFMERLLTSTPALEQVISKVLCLEDATPVDTFIVKDISLLLHNRELEDIFVVDTNPNQVQEEVVAHIAPDPYDGLIPYT